MQIEVFNKSRHNPETVKQILAMAMGNPTPENLVSLIDDFYNDDNHSLFVAFEGSMPIGAIGIDQTDKSMGYITHLAVLPRKRKQGIGRRLINGVAEKLELSWLELETDQEAVGFYEACGFDTTEIESRYPGIRRFKCIRNMIE
jgi:ribosomal protein S18 acetylase RimI-like enzyme